MHPALVGRIARSLHRHRVTVLCLALVVALGGCRGSTGPSAGGLRVLFVGNSLTSVNDLPRMFAAVAASGGFRVSTGRIVFDDVSLSDHLLRGDAVDAIQEGDWDYVVMQQGPSGRPDSRTQLIEATRQFATVIRAAGATPVLYMVWPDASRPTAFDSVSASYTAAADDVDALLAPAGDAWIAAWERKATLPLYGNDGFHPGSLGSYLAALSLYGVLCDRSPASLDTRPVGVNAVRLRGVSDADLRIAQEAAAEVTSVLARKGLCDPGEPTLRAATGR